MLKHETVFISISSLKKSEPVFHKGVGHYLHVIEMKCNPKRLHEYECIKLPYRHAVKFAHPCHNCYPQLKD